MNVLLRSKLSSYLTVLRGKQLQREATDEYKNKKLSILKEIAKSAK